MAPHFRTIADYIRMHGYTVDAVDVPTTSTTDPAEVFFLVTGGPFEKFEIITGEVLRRDLSLRHFNVEPLYRQYTHLAQDGPDGEPRLEPVQTLSEFLGADADGPREQYEYRIVRVSDHRTLLHFIVTVDGRV